MYQQFEWLSEFDIINLKDTNNQEQENKNASQNSQINNCHLCGAKFSTFFVRSNRCDLCLNLYCNSCIIKLQTKIKICKVCHKMCMNFNKTIQNKLIKIKENDSRYIEMRESYYCKTFDDYQFSCQNFLANENTNFEQKLLININDSYELITKTLINYILKVNFENDKIVEEWKSIIYILIKETISNLRPSSRYLNDSLDIDNYVKIKIIPYKDNSKCQVIQGYALHNKSTGKNIKDNIDNPKILLINKELITDDDQDEIKEKSNIDNLEDSKENQLKLTKFIENKLDLIKPDIVIFGKTYPKEIIKLLINNDNLSNIIFIYDISNYVMNNLSRCFQTLILPSFKLIGKNYILGSCKRFYIEKYLDNENNSINNNHKKNEESNIQIEDEIVKKESDDIIYKNNKDKKDNDLFIFDGCNRLLFNTIILSGKDIILLKRLKIILKQIIIPSIRDLFLQKYLIYTLNMEISPVPQETDIEIEFIEELLDESHEITPIKSNFFSLNSKINRNRDKPRRLSLRLSSKNEIQKSDIDQLFYEGFDLSIIEKKEDFNIYSLTSLSSSQKNKKIENLKDDKDEDISEKEIHNIVNKYCEDSKEINFSFFNGDTKYDKSLGKFILELGEKSSSICPTCKLEYNKHTQYLYRAKGVLKFWMISGNEYDLEKVISYLNEKTKIDYSKILIYKDTDFTSDIVYTNIYTYGYCNICKSIVTPLFKISNEVFNYSSSKFIRFMLENHLSINQKRNFDYNISNIVSNKKCEHQVNQDISRIFITRFGSWIFECNDIIKHYISPLNLDINNSFSKNKLEFKEYEHNGYSNSINTIKLILKALKYQKSFFEELLNDDKLYIFKEYISSIIIIIDSLNNFTENCMVEMIKKYLKNNIDKYDNNYTKLIANIKKIYFKIVKIKLIVNRIERAKISVKVISDILNDKIPISLDETKKLHENLIKEKKIDSSNKLNSPSEEINFEKCTSFKNIMTFINYSDENHDQYSCEFKKTDLSSYIGNILSSNEYIENMNLKDDLNLTTIKRKKTSNIMVDDIIKLNLSKKRRFSSFKKVEEKRYFFDKIDKGVSRKISFDDNNDNTGVFDTLLIFDQSKQSFFIEHDEEGTYSDAKIKEILENTLLNKDKEPKTYHLTNDLYSILIKKRNSEDEGKNIKKNANSDSQNNENSNNEGSSNDIIKLTKLTVNNKDENKNGNKLEKHDLDLTKKNSHDFSDEIKKDYIKNLFYFKDLEKQLYDSNNLLKELREKLINIIKIKIENNKKNKKKPKDIKKNKEEKDKDKENNEIKENDQNKENNENKENDKNKENNDNKENDENPKDKEKDKENNDNNNIKEEINENKIKEDIENKDIKEIEDKKNNIKDEKEEIKDEKDREDTNDNPEDHIPLFPSVPEFEEISNAKLNIFFEEKRILKDPKQIEIIIYYPKQFEALRIAYCTSFEDLLISLSKSTESENNGGKSKAKFYKTFDEKFILKSINENEFNMFIEKGLDYFNYMAQFIFHKMPSALAKILGAFQIIVKQKNKEVKHNLILMENIYFGIISETDTTFNSPDSNIRVYDLKGSNVNRYINKNVRNPGQVLLDTNFLVDFNKEPIFIDSNVYDRLKLALYNDSSYLEKLEVVDYSLLIIFFNDKEKEKNNNMKKIEDNVNNGNINYLNDDNNYRLIKLGIIDYTRKYTWDKKVEFYGKSLLYGENPTIVEPTEYSKRFYSKLTKYFVGV